VEDEELHAHRIILTARSPVFRALLNSDMREVQEGVVSIEDIRPQVFSAMLHFLYKDGLPEVRPTSSPSCPIVMPSRSFRSLPAP
jgi:speckle-type POZ protein